MMGVHKNVGMKKFPKQYHWVGKRCEVCFDYDTKNTIGGVFVRCDIEEPGISIIKLDDDRYVLATECQHTQPE